MHSIAAETLMSNFNVKLKGLFIPWTKNFLPHHF